MSERKVHIDLIRVGDTVLCPDGEARTVCAHNIGGDRFTGKTLWGDSYQCGHKPVTIVEPPQHVRRT